MTDVCFIFSLAHSCTHTAVKRKHSPCIFCVHQWVNAFGAASSPELLAAAAAAMCVCCDADVHRLYNHRVEEEEPMGSGRQDARL